MKTLIILSIVILCSLKSEISWSQWQSDIRLTNDPSTSITAGNNARSIEARGDSLHLIWVDYRDGNMEIYYKHSFDRGVSWSPDTRLTNTPGYSELPSIAVSGSTVHVAWSEEQGPYGNIFYKRSTNGGMNWADSMKLTVDSLDAGPTEVSIAVSGQTVHLVWCDFRSYNFEIYYKRSTDGGLSWSSDIKLTNNSSESLGPSICVSGQMVHLFWNDHGDKLYYTRSTDAGISWDSAMQLSAGITNNPSCAVSGLTVHALWYDSRNGPFDIYYKRSTDGGINWEPDVRLTNEGGNSWNPSVSVSASSVNVVWNNNSVGNYEIYYKHSSDGGLNWEARTRLTNNSANSERPFVSESDSVVHVAWSDMRDGNEEIYYKNDRVSQITGNHSTGTQLSTEFRLEQNYPNPFNPSTKIVYSIPKNSNVKLVVYDALGKETAVLVNGYKQAGNYSESFNASSLATGVYFYKLETDGFTEIKKMVLIK